MDATNHRRSRRKPRGCVKSRRKGSPTVNNIGCKHHHQGSGKLRRGPSSFWMHDPDVVFDFLALKQGNFVLDLGCGPGEYSIHAAGLVGDSGVVYALEKWAYMIDGLKEEADDRGIWNIKTMTADITETFPINDQSIDVCLLSTVLHMFDLSIIEAGLFTQIRRVLKPDGRVAVIECKKEPRLTAILEPPKYEITGFAGLFLCWNT